MAITINGDWKVRVTTKNAGWEQRFLVAGSAASDGIYPGVVGTQIEAGGASWTMQVQARNGSGPWLDSGMQIGPEVPWGVSTRRVIGTNDQGGSDQDFDDLVLELRKKVDPILEIVQRPYALDPTTLMMNPDGVFFAGGGLQLMGVRVRNTWDRPMPADQWVDISELGRLQLAAQGIQVVDSWTDAERARLGQTMTGRSPFLGPLAVGGERTVYFKVDCSAARTGTPEVELISARFGPEPDMDDPARRARRKLFVAEIRYDPASREVVAHAPEGTLRLQLQKVTLDPKRWNEVRDCLRKALQGGRGGGAHRLQRRVREILRDLESGRCDPCKLQDLLTLYCECAGHGGDGGSGPGGGRPPGQPGQPGQPGGMGGVNPCAFFWLPLEFSYVVDAPFDGQYGPLAFQDPWWKVLALLIMIALLIAAALVDILDEAHENPEIVIGTVDRFSTGNVDAALIALNGTRSFDLGVLDAQSGEPNTNPRIALGAVVPIVRSVAAPFVGMRVYKSGARTGFTHGLVTSINATTNQCRGEFEDATSTCTPDPDRPNLVMTGQVRIGTSAAFPGEPTTDNGDSGSLWLSDEPATRDQVVALTHSGGSNSSDANPINDVLAALNVRLNP
jgi:hypothetical protein